MISMMDGSGLKFGVHSPPEGKDFKTMKNLCQTAERIGYDLFTVTDHFMNMANPAGPSNHPLESWSVLAGLAAATSRISLGPLVCCANYRHPTVLAKIATTVDIISEGHLVFGIGAGWHEMEFERFLGRFPTAKERLDGLEDAVQICRSMFTHKYTEFSGKIYSAKEALNSPNPVQKSIPIMIGGSGEKRTLKIAAKYADIVHLSGGPSAQEVQHKLDVLRSHCSHLKRNFSDIRIATGFTPILDESASNIRAQAERIAAIRFQGQISAVEAEKIVLKTTGPKNILATIKEYQRLGVTAITMNSLGLEEMKSIKDQILSKLNH